MKPWIKESEKTALYYNGDSYTYNDLIKVAKEKTYAAENEFGVFICSCKNPYKQLISFIHGLINDKPIYFGNQEESYFVGKDVALENVFLVASTSGTTGRKKWIYKQSDQWLRSFEPHGEFFRIYSEDSLFINGSLSYTANLFSVLQILFVGGSVVLSEDKNPRRWLDLIEKYKCTIAFLVPSKLRLLSKGIFSKWSHKIAVTTAGEPLQQRVLETLYEKAPNMLIHHYYGAAEMGHISAIRHDELKIRPNSVGKAFPGVKILVKDGIIYGHSLYSYSGGMAMDTAYDYGELDEEGYLYIKGRQDTQYNVYGRKFDALKLVRAIKKLMTVEDCLLIDFRKEKSMDDKDKEVYGLFVIGECSEQAVSEALNEFPGWQQPMTIKIVPNGIYSDTGKYDMVKIKEIML